MRLCITNNITEVTKNAKHILYLSLSTKQLVFYFDDTKENCSLSRKKKKNMKIFVIKFIYRKFKF